jgi:hypothetical protein
MLTSFVFLREVRGHERSWTWFGEAGITAVVINGGRGRKRKRDGVE